jgi:hypothetical protein
MQIDPEGLGRFFKTHNSRFSKCLEPKMNCNQEPIRAHSIQNSGVIDLIALGGHVVAFRPSYSSEGLEVEFKLVGRNHASTFTGLCNEHDTKLFLPLDTKPLDVTDREQLFLLAYRSVTRELHAVMEGAIKMQSGYLSRVERGIDPEDDFSPAGMRATQHLMNSYLTYEYRAVNYDKPLISGNFDAIEHDIVLLENQLPVIAVSSLFSLDHIEVDDDVARVVLNVVPMSSDRTLVVFSYTPADRRAAKPALDRVLMSQGAYQKYELSRLILSRVENVLLSPTHFNAWDQGKASRIKEAFAGTIMNQLEVPDDPAMMLF